MTEQERILFEKLTEDRKDSARVLEKQSMSGVKDSVTEKYSDQAHFIYELLQNADDVYATEARFELYEDRLVFIHNGARLFSVTDLDDETEDTLSGKLGDINSITSVANSSKTSSSIGKFGVGFKAVFQYTTTPFIYDPNLSFKIERFIVPIIIEDTFNNKKSNETAFVFPFDHPIRKVSEAYKDILYKLQKLVFPTLFLKHLNKVSYRCGNISGEYKKKELEVKKIDQTTCVLLELTNGNNSEIERLWLFSRETTEGYKYSCGFFIDANGKLIAKDYYAFCFFPTKKSTNLNFIINAPFILTDSREGIKATDKHNIRMIKLLAELSADCFLYLRDIGIEKDIFLIDDSILSYLPIEPKKYIPKNEYDDISFYPFYEAILKVFKNETILPSFSNYVHTENAYIAQSAVISQLFSNEQLALLTENEDAKWILPNIGWESISRTHDGRDDYLYEILENSTIQHVGIIRKITAEFIEQQPKEWLFMLYDYILENDNRMSECKTIPILLNQNGEAIAAYTRFGRATLFLDDGNSQNYDVVLDELLENESTRVLIERLGIKKPENKDKIAKLLNKDSFDYLLDFQTFIDYYIELFEANKSSFDFIQDLKDKEFILGETEGGISSYAFNSYKLYFPSQDLKKYFAHYDDVAFVNISFYQSNLSGKQNKYLNDFLNELGIKNYVGVIKSECKKENIYSEFGTNWDTSTNIPKWYDYCLEGYDSAVKRIIENNDIELSVIVWKQLVNLFETKKYESKPLKGVYNYFFRKPKMTDFEGFCAKVFKHSLWLFDYNQKPVSPDKSFIQDLDRRYDTAGNGSKRLIDFLGIQDKHPEYENLDESTKEKLQAYESLKNLGIFDLSPEMLEDVKKHIDHLKSNEECEASLSHAKEEVEESVEEKVAQELKTRVKKNPQEEAKKSATKQPDIESDDFTKSSVDFEQKKSQAMDECERKIAEIAQIEKATEKAENSDRYSYAWFEALLELEAIADGEDNANSREVSITFSKAIRDDDTSWTLTLSNPDKNIPSVMEALFDIPVNFTFDDGNSKQFVAEAFSVLSYTLKIRIKPNDEFKCVDFSELKSASIHTKNPSFLIQGLQSEFHNLALPDEFNMQENLCENIRFIFGPPGTGKTTYLATNILIPLIQKEPKAKILVLTPTNKASDVLVEKVMNVMGEDKSYEEWLIRHGTTFSKIIENSLVFKGREVSIGNMKKCVVATTAIRLAYDYFIDNGKFVMINEIDWDYIVVDEASMIPLSEIVYTLYRKNPKKFIIAGDPFQIEPTQRTSNWEGENIYSMVHLNEFSDDVNTIPHKYEITLLTKQYRSIESIGEVFSQLTYRGVLEHARKNEDARPLNIEKYIEYENLNIIKFPVSKYESIFKPNKLKSSNYHIYSALFVYEFASFLANAISECNDKNEKYKIGIISPYATQAGLVNKLLASACIPENIEVISGTIHGFQGDECDIVIALFNPPPRISMNEKMFLNRQNIINVAISRARDYLFVVMPDDNTENIRDLYLINRLIGLIKDDHFSEFNSNDLEELMFDDCDYIEQNAFSTGHQQVNVYGIPEKRYEVRSEESALDVQVHGISHYAPLAEMNVIANKYSVEDYSRLIIGQEVSHNKFGIGRIISCIGTMLTAQFPEGNKNFAYPNCFEKFLKLTDRNYQNEIVDIISNG